MDDAMRPRLAASRLLHWLEEQDRSANLSRAAATPVDQLRELLGLQVALFHPDTRREGTYGWLEPGENLIFLRQGLSEPVRRFTLAHEIGHAVLHRASGIDSLNSLARLAGGLAAPSRDLLMPEVGTGCEGSDLDAPLMALAPGDEILRPGEAYSARAQRESEANAFAATLLLPPDRLLAGYLARARQQSAFAGRRPGAITRGLSREFGVSEDVVLRSLAALLQTGIGPDEGEVREAGAFTEGALTNGIDDATRLNLDPSQRQASTVEAPALIVAGPGTGKTSTLVGRVAYLVREHGVAPDAILALTFSNKAAREMRERLATLLQSPGLASERTAPAMPTVSTIHAFCGDLVRRYAPLVGLRPDFRLASEAEGYFLLRQVASEMMLRHYQPLAAPGLHFPALLAAISRAKDELAGPERYREVAERMAEKATTLEERLAAERASEVASIYAAYQDLLRSRGDADFGDLICLSVQLLREQPEILAEVQSQYHHILVDEFQDINRAMGVLLRILSGEAGSLWAVGDADQAIYRFRGASPANLAQFASDFPSARVQTLQRNYRSTPEILSAAAAVAAAALGGDRAPLQAARDASPAVAAMGAVSLTLATAPNEQSELAGLAEKIKQRAQAGRSLGDQVVLCRTRRQCQRVASALSAAGIPVRMATSLLEQDDAKDMLAVLSLLGDVSGSGLLRAGNIPDHAFGEQEARSVLAEARNAHQSPLVTLLQRVDSVEPVTPSGRAGLATLAQIVSELQQAPDILTAVSRYIFSYTRIGYRLMRRMRPPEHDGKGLSSEPVDTAQVGRVTQLLGLARAFEDQQRSQRSRLSPSSPASGDRVMSLPPKHADWPTFLEYIRVLLLLRQETVGFEESSGNDTPSVRILTVHASKGLEFPVVYLPGLADRRFPMQRRGSSAPLLPGISQDEATTPDNPSTHLAEEACLFYVALTRAQDELVLSWAEFYGRMRYRISPFLAPIGTALGARLCREQWAPALPPPASPPVRPETLPAPSRALQGPVRHSEIEMYQRCPRQYAYRYVYNLQPREIGLATLRYVLHATLSRLQRRLARLGRGHAAGGRTVRLSLQDAQNLFQNEWEKKLEQEKRIAQSGEAREIPTQVEEPNSALGDPFLEVYRRHGLQVVERAWREMMQHQPAASAEPAPDSSRLAFDTQEMHFDEQMTVQVRGRELSVVLDRVERGVASDSPDSSGGQSHVTSGPERRAAAKDRSRSQGGTSVPLRLVRHRLGNNGVGKPDLHALFYTLAAQQGGGQATELYSHNLTTGELDRVVLDERKIAKLYDELDAILEGIESGYFPPRPDPNLCSSCPFLLICPA